MDSRIELNIYNSEDEIIKTYSSRGLRWGILEDAMALNEDLKNMGEAEQLKAVNKIIAGVYPDITDEHLKLAYLEDIMICFKSILSRAQGIQAKK